MAGWAGLVALVPVSAAPVVVDSRRHWPRLRHLLLLPLLRLVVVLTVCLSFRRRVDR
jgi:hypothetical protein